MKRRSKKLSKIVSLAASEERRHGANVGKSQADLDDHLQRLGELNAYRHNYAELPRSLSSVGSAQLKDYHTFMSRLDQAVKSQQDIVRDSEQNLEMHRRRWMEKRQRLESLQRLLDGYYNDEARHAERLEQRTLDDLPTAGNVFDEADDT